MLYVKHIVKKKTGGTMFKFILCLDPDRPFETQKNEYPDFDSARKAAQSFGMCVVRVDYLVIYEDAELYYDDRNESDKKECANWNDNKLILCKTVEGFYQHISSGTYFILSNNGDIFEMDSEDQPCKKLPKDSYVLRDM